MTKEEFISKFKNSCKNSVLFKNKEVYTVNELLYILSSHKDIGIPDYFCIVVGEEIIPCLDAFVPVKTRAKLFDISDVEYEEETDESDGIFSSVRNTFGSLTIKAYPANCKI